MPSRLNSQAFIIALTLIISGCVTIYNPATQRQESLLIDTKQEVALGRQMDSQVEKDYKIL